jgi:glycosyltransferase 2 family protein
VFHHQRAALAEVQWAVPWRAAAASAAAFALAALVQGLSFALALRMLTGTTPLGDALLVWSRSYVVRYAPTGALAIAYRVAARQRMNATSERVLAAYGYEHVATLAAGAAWLVATYTAGYLVGFVTPLAPGGLGAREGMLVVLLRGRYGFGPAAAISIAIRVVNVAGELLAVAMLHLVYGAVALRRGARRPQPQEAPA